jgi:hypothetical protein
MQIRWSVKDAPNPLPLFTLFEEGSLKLLPQQERLKFRIPVP